MMFLFILLFISSSSFTVAIDSCILSGYTGYSVCFCFLSFLYLFIFVNHMHLVVVYRCTRIAVMLCIIYLAFCVQSIVCSRFRRSICVQPFCVHFVCDSLVWLIGAIHLRIIIV